MILTLDGHFGAVWSLCVSSRGDFIVSASHDRSLRVWERTDEQLFLDEEREKQLESLFDASAAENVSNTESSLAPPPAAASLGAADRLIEALDIASGADSGDNSGADSGADSGALHPLVVASGCASSSAYLLSVLASVRASELESALLLLSFGHVHALLRHLDDWLSRGRNAELCCRVLHFVVGVHQAQIVSNRAFRPALASVGASAQRLLGQYKDAMGFNRAAMAFAVRRAEEKGVVGVEIEREEEEGKKGGKKGGKGKKEVKKQRIV